MRVASLVAFSLIAILLAGCVAQSDWARDSTGISVLAGQGYTGAGVTVAIVDTGIDASHPLFGGARIRWADLVGNAPRPFDDNGHGTHVAGIVAARPDAIQELFRGVSVRGGAPGVELLVVKAIRADGSGDDSTVADAVRAATQNGADVIALSLGGEKGFLIVGTDTENAVKDALAAGVYVIAAAGNAHGEEDDVASPASVEGVIAVGAVDRSLRLAPFSQHGKNSGQLPPLLGGRSDPNKKPEVVAPGVGILSTWKDGAYANADGTSQAAPFVAASLALVLQAKPAYQRGGSSNSIAIMKTALERSAQKIGPLSGGGASAHDDGYGYGLVRADRWLAELP